MPESIAQTEQARLGIAGQNPAVLVKVGHIIVRHRQAALGGFGKVAGGLLHRTEMLRERILLLVGDVLARQYEHCVMIHRRFKAGGVGG